MKKSPTLLLISGPPGSGKSRLAESLSSCYSLPIIDYDVVCQPFLQSIVKRCNCEETYEESIKAWRQETYDSVMNIVVHNIKLGQSVVVCAPFSKEKRDAQYFSLLQEKNKIKFKSYAVDLQPSKEMLLQNLTHRDLDRDEDKIRGWDEYFTTHIHYDMCWDATYSYPVKYTSINTLFDSVRVYLEKHAFGPFKQEGYHG